MTTNGYTITIPAGCRTIQALLEAFQGYETRETGDLAKILYGEDTKTNRERTSRIITTTRRFAEQTYPDLVWFKAHRGTYAFVSTPDEIDRQRKETHRLAQKKCNEARRQAQPFSITGRTWAWKERTNAINTQIHQLEGGYQ